MSALLDAVLGLGSGVLDVLDMPGSYLRGALGGRLGERLSGREMLDEWGVTDKENDPNNWFEAGDIAGFGAEMIADPLNILGLGMLGKTAKAAKAAKANNALRETLLSQGAMPDEIAKLTKYVDEAGNPRPVYAPKIGDDPMGWLDALEESNTFDGSYAFYRNSADAAKNPARVNRYFVDSRSPLDMSRPLTRDEFSRMAGIADDVRQNNLDDMLFNDPDKFNWYTRTKDSGSPVYGDSLSDAVGAGKEITSKAAESAGRQSAGGAIRGDDLMGVLDNYTAGGEMEVFRRMGLDTLANYDPMADRFLQRGMIYGGEIAPPARSVPNMAPLLATLLGYNTLNAMD